ncbi:MAG TPA: cytochrome b/b6 domain-containing protein [Verrucomicrobiae bacterium]|nr:cytochrome b/b6 domain-containing protein [Verrucomicrobiae bacterium]
MKARLICRPTASRAARHVPALLLLACGLSAAEPRKNSDCLECHADNTLSKTNAAGQTVSLFVDSARYEKSVHGTNACMSCHADIAPEHPDNNVAAKRVDCSACHPYQSVTYQGSAHALAIKSGEEGAAICSDCHGKHDIISPDAPESRLHHDKVAATCGECHSEITDAVAKSIHGKSTAEGHREAATCIDCHSEHKIEDLRATSPLKISEQICSKCHASERINTKFRLPSDRVSTFMESYHGLASQYGSMRAANCSSCHGSHLILPSSDPLSSINTNNLVATCGKCHPGATENFASGRIHTDGAPGKEFGTRINFWVRRIYLWLIFGTIGLMFAHNFATWGRRAMAAFRAADRIVLRMDRPQRIQHFILAASFIVLAVTGFALKFPDSWVARLLGSDENLRRISHRVAGIVMLVLGAYHVFYVMFAREGRRLLRDMLPRGQDVRDAVTNVKHLLLRGRPRPRFGRFGYPEKLEYWAVAWGTIIMGVTGLMIWFKIDVTQFLPRWAIDVATTIHYYEAILACLAILVWHFYFVFIDPEVYPINWAWWDGRVPKEWHDHEHPLDNPTIVVDKETPRPPDPPRCG